ncbi:Na+(H+)/acetate symporter ActP [Paraburkholderia sp. GAS334]
MVLTLLSKSVWVDVLHRAHALVFLDNPTLVSVPLAFGGIWIFSMLDRGAREQQEREAFALQEFYGQTGILSVKAVDH